MPPPPEDQFVEVNGARLHYLDWGGDGPLLLLVHGFTDAAGTFAGIAPSFTDRYRVMAVTRRGHGLSDPPPEWFDVDLNVDDLAGFISEFSSTPAIVAGISHGGLEIPRLARRYPDLVRGLVFLDAIYDWRELRDRPPEPGIQVQGSYPSYDRLDADYAARYDGFWSEAYRRHVHSLTYARDDGMIGFLIDRPGQGAARYMELWDEWDPADYAAISVPVLAIVADQGDYLAANLVRRDVPDYLVDSARSWARAYDDAIKAAGVELLTQAVSDAEIVDLQAHHSLHVHRPREVVAAMNEFLARLPARSPRP